MKHSKINKQKGKPQTKTHHDQYLTSKQALALLGTGAILCAFAVMPGLAYIGKAYLDWKYRNQFEKNYTKLKKYNPSKLRQTFRRLHQQKDVKIITIKGIDVVELTLKGKRRLLKYNLQNMSLDTSSWDGKWRLISYDIPETKAKARDSLRYMLKRLEVQKLQGSLYITPYRCEKEINYLREIYQVGEYVLLITASNLEGESHFKSLFKLT